MEIPAQIFKALAKLPFDVKDHRHVMQAVWFEPGGRIIASDGYVLTVVKLDNNEGPEAVFNIHGAKVIEAARLIKAHDKQNIEIAGSSILLPGGNVCSFEPVVAQLFNWRAVTPPELELGAHAFNADLLLKLLNFHRALPHNYSAGNTPVTMRVGSRGKDYPHLVVESGCPGAKAVSVVIGLRKECEADVWGDVVNENSRSV